MMYDDRGKIKKCSQGGRMLAGRERERQSEREGEREREREPTTT